MNEDSLLREPWCFPALDTTTSSPKRLEPDHYQVKLFYPGLRYMRSFYEDAPRYLHLPSEEEDEFNVPIALSAFRDNFPLMTSVEDFIFALRSPGEVASVVGG